MDDINKKQNKINIKISGLKAGMKIARKIEDKYGGILLPEGTILDKKKINRLKRLDYDYIYIYDEEEKTIDENLKRIKNIELRYREKLDKMGKIFKKTRKMKKIDYEDVKELTHEVSILGDDQELINLLTKVRDVDKYTYSHLLNVGILAYMFGNWLDLDNNRCFELTQSGLIHDLGKIYIPDEILKKPGKLTKKEYQLMKKHSLYGYQIVKNSNKISEETARGVLTHHERYNGRGYPMGLKNGKIPLFGRILAIIDTFDAMTAERIYQPGSSPFAVIKLFREGAFGEFDYKLLKIFLEKMPDYFVNEKVILKDGREAKVIFINPRHQDCPIIEVDGKYIDLYKNDSIEIDRMVSDHYHKKEI